MNFYDYMNKIQEISKILEQKKSAEDILNSKEIDISNDFQYICLSSASNYDLVVEVIARISQNGNKDIVENNIKYISINIWKDLFNKNKFTKDLFIENYDKILDNAGILTYREIENFVEDNQVRPLIYNSLDLITKKLCTYDRAALITKMKSEEDGIVKIKGNLNLFFQKGEYDISTTYSRILDELSKIQEISKVEILKACSKNLGEMLERETAIDNETNNLLNWIYDAMEETKMLPDDRAELQNDIDKAIMFNFYTILDKSNYDKETIKVLKQFKCTQDQFEKERNVFIEKSNKLIHMTKIYEFNHQNKTIENSDKNINTSKIENDINVSNKENSEIINIENMQQIEGNNDETNILEENSICNISDVQKFEEFSKENDDTKGCKIADSNEIENDIIKDEIADDTCNNQMNYLENNEDIDKEFSKLDLEKNEINNKEFEDINVLSKFDELLNKSKENNNIKENALSDLIRKNIKETDSVIDKVMKKSSCNTEKNVVTNIITVDSKENIAKNINISEVDKKDNIQLKNNDEENKKALILKEESIELPKEQHIIKRIFSKILKFFSNKFGTEKIGE
mgnify:FL=1